MTVSSTRPISARGARPGCRRWLAERTALGEREPPAGARARRDFCGLWGLAPRLERAASIRCERGVVRVPAIFAADRRLPARGVAQLPRAGARGRGGRDRRARQE